jgi:hypothetical protein
MAGAQALDFFLGLVALQLLKNLLKWQSSHNSPGRNGASILHWGQVYRHKAKAGALLRVGRHGSLPWDSPIISEKAPDHKAQGNQSHFVI